MNNSVFQNINKIIERDSKATTYKFALLRGVIDIIQDNSPFITISKDRIYFPTGLLIEKWMLYYYPILELKGTITTMPMKYIGRSISNDYYSIFKFENDSLKRKTTEIDLEFLIHNSGSFSIPFEYYEAFKILGSFISGQDSILFKWAEFSVNASRKNLSIEKVVSEVLKSPITERDVAESKQIYKTILKEEGKVFCVWTGKAITSYDVDHMIPFSVWKNNDLWNLLPSQSKTNNQKRDKIPSVDLIEKRKELILHYWELINENQSKRFQKEIRVALLGNSLSEGWQNSALKQLQSSCNYLISNRGYEEWNI
ncbi:MAG: hypothetical protein NTU43_09175 [Bacteroidetes bacterium]|nr:hypothetical protein [Bacteroidota bacterium]